MLVKIKEILTKIYFGMPHQTFGANLYYFHPIYRLYFWLKFSLLKVSRQ